MADIAQIGFSAETSDLDTAKTKLNQLVPAAGSAEKASSRLASMFSKVDAAADKLMAAANGLSAAAEKLAAASGRAANSNSKLATTTDAAAGASKKAAIAAAAEATALAKVAAAADNAAASKMRFSKSGVPLISREKPVVNPWERNNQPQQMPYDNDNRMQQSVGAMKANVGNIAAQFQDIGVTAAMGMNPLLIALQQGTQLSAVFAQTGGNAFKQLGAAILQIVSPTALLTIGLVALGVALIQMVDWTKLAQTILYGLASILPQVALGVTALGAAVALAFAPAILSAFWSAFVTLAVGIIATVGSVILAIGLIPIAIGLIVAGLYVFSDEISQILGFDILAAAKKGVNYIIGAFVGAYHDIEFLWKQFPNIIGAAAIGAANMAIRAVNKIIQAGVEGINYLIRASNTLTTLGGTIDGPTMGEVDFKPFDEMANSAADALTAAVGDRSKQLQNDLNKDYLGAISNAVEGAASTAAKKLKDFAEMLDDTKAKKPKGASGKTEGEKFSDIVAGAERTIATLQAEKDAIGLSAEATARLKYETQLLNEAKQKNIALSPEQRAQLMGLASDMAALESSTAKAREALDFARDTTKGFVSDFVSGLRQGKSAFQSFTDALLNLANKLIDRGLNGIIDKLFEIGSASGGLNGSGSGLGGIFGGILKLFGFAKGGAFKNGISGHSNSVVSKPTMFAFAKGAGLMGEAGPEAIMPLKRGSDGSLGVQVHNDSNRSNSGPASNNVKVENHYTIAGAISERTVVDQIRRSAEQTKDDTKNSIMGWLQEYQQNGAMSG